MFLKKTKQKKQSIFIKNTNKKAKYKKNRLILSLKNKDLQKIYFLKNIKQSFLYIF
jgi:hypothetical protein